MCRLYLLLVLLLGLLSPVSATAQAVPNKVDDEFIHRQFGKEFTMLPDFPVLLGDFDGDGVEDAAIAARCKNPLLDVDEHHYKVQDPYFTFYGYGDPKVTMSFGDDDPSRRGLVMLIIHGAGPQAWRGR